MYDFPFRLNMPCLDLNVIVKHFVMQIHIICKDSIAIYQLLFVTNTVSYHTHTYTFQMNTNIRIIQIIRIMDIRMRTLRCTQ